MGMEFSLGALFSKVARLLSHSASGAKNLTQNFNANAVDDDSLGRGLTRDRLDTPEDTSQDRASEKRENQKAPPATPVCTVTLSEKQLLELERVKVRLRANRHRDMER